MSKQSPRTKRKVRRRQLYPTKAAAELMGCIESELIPLYEAQSGPADTVQFSQVSDPTDWSPKEDFDALTFGSYTDAKKAEVLFNRLVREREEAMKYGHEWRLKAALAKRPEAGNSSDAKDAARYRWLREHPALVIDDMDQTMLLDHEALDYMVDAARRSATSSSEGGQDG